LIFWYGSAALIAVNMSNGNAKKAVFEAFTESSLVYPNSKEENWSMTKVLLLHA